LYLDTNQSFKIFLLKKRFFIPVTILFTLFSHISLGQEGFEVREIRFRGNDIFSEETLLDQMNTQPITLIQNLTFWKSGPEFSSLMFENDLERLSHFYQQNGYLNPQFDYTLEKDEKKEQVRIIIEVARGKAVKITNLQVEHTGDSLVSSVMSSWKDTMTLDTGDRFADKRLLEAEANIKEQFRDRGYPFVDVKRALQVQPSRQAVDVRLRVEPGPRAYFGPVSLEGDSLVSESYIRKRLKFSPGDVFSQQKLDASQSNLFDTDLFRYVVVRAQKDSIQGGQIPVLIEVSEEPPWALETGVGYGTEDRFRASARLSKLHFLGGARKMILEGKHSHFLPISLEAKFIQPSLLAENQDLILNPFFIRENEISYEVDRLGGSFTLQQEFSRRSSAYLMYSFERVFVQDFSRSDVPREKDIRNKSGVTLGYRNSSTDSRFYPTRGWQFDGHITYMGLGFRSRFHYYMNEMGLVRYYELADDWVLAGRIRVGFIYPLRGEETPIEDRFLLGGASSLRGWGRHQVSPVNQEGKPIGGNSMLESSLELRFPLYDILSGVVFADVGNVWRDAFQYQPRDLRYDAGAGLRVRTPVGPVRLDLATPVLQHEFKPRFFISIGHAF
jgi:outer membrane protein insertion porin family